MAIEQPAILTFLYYKKKAFQVRKAQAYLSSQPCGSSVRETWEFARKSRNGATWQALGIILEAVAFGVSHDKQYQQYANEMAQIAFTNSQSCFLEH